MNPKTPAEPEDEGRQALACRLWSSTAPPARSRPGEAAGMPQLERGLPEAAAPKRLLTESVLADC